MKTTASRRRVTTVALAACGFLLSATALGIGLRGALDKPATLMSPADYLAAKATIEDDSRTALDMCLIHEGTVLGICQAQAQAEARMHRAMLEAKYLGTVEAAESARQVKADAAYDVAVAKCEAREGKVRLECLRGAHVERIKQLSQSL